MLIIGKVCLSSTLEPSGFNNHPKLGRRLVDVPYLDLLCNISAFASVKPAPKSDIFRWKFVVKTKIDFSIDKYEDFIQIQSLFIF